MSILFDHGRKARIGLPEAVFCEGKPLEDLLKLLESFAKGREKPILFTRLAKEIFTKLPKTLQDRYDYDPLSRTAFGEKMPAHPQGSCAIVSAGTADGFVSHEAARTLEYLGFNYDLLEDCGVAGLWRLTERLDLINKADCVIVIAGLDAALASVLGGLTPKPIFAVPTSIGYGVADKGRTALQSMLVSCAPGVSVLNIDNGYGAACAAARVLLSLESKLNSQK